MHLHHNLTTRVFLTMRKTQQIALVSHRIEKNDGQGRVNYEIAKAALKRGYRVTLLAAHCAPEIAQHPLSSFVRLGNENKPTQLLRNLSFAQSSSHWLRQNRLTVDVVQANGFITWAAAEVVVAHFVHGAWMKNFYYPFRMFWKSPYAAYQRVFTSLNARWERNAFAKAKIIVAVSEKISEELRSIGVPSSKIRVIYNGVDTVEFSPGPPQRSYFGLPESVPMAIFAGDLKTSRKNLDTVLNAIRMLPGVHLAVAGGADGSPYLALAQRLGVHDRVHFLGRVSEMPLLMKSADCFIFPSRYDPLGLVILEAMATGLPVITSANAGGAELLGEAGRIMRDPEDAALLSRWLSELLMLPALRQHMGEAARNKALANQWATMAQSYINIYEELGEKSPSLG
jgi:glycosyltransferase involved in cell wall biosynthesis